VEKELLDDLNCRPHEALPVAFGTSSGVVNILDSAVSSCHSRTVFAMNAHRGHWREQNCKERVCKMCLHQLSTLLIRFNIFYLLSR